MNFEKGMTYKAEDDILLVCFELTETFAFLCPAENGALDLTKVNVYSAKEGDTPIEAIEVADKDKQL